MAVAQRLLGTTLVFKGDFAKARAHFEQSQQLYDPETDREANFRFGMDEAGATARLAFAAWPLGDVGDARGR
jgi:hypothetical protein